MVRYPTGVKNPDAILAAAEQLPEAEEPSTKWERKQRLTRDWRSATPEQGNEVLRLVKEHRGALVRSLPEGTAEVLTGRKGDFVRYRVGEDGTSTVAESIPSDGTHELLGKIVLGCLAVFVLSWIVAPIVEHWAFPILAFVAFVVGVFAFIARGSGETEQGALLQTKRGERWTSLGYPQD